jgi:hypothetical protein
MFKILKLRIFNLFEIWNLRFGASRAMSLIDVIVGTAIMLVVFLSIFGAFKLSIDLIYSTKAKTGAVALVADRLEYIRGLPYDSVGTLGGIPPGTLPQVATSTLNGLAYTFATLVQYVDDPADGTGDADENSVTADYKIVKVEANWMVRGSSRSTYAVTTVAPLGLETMAAGGTITVNVLNSLAMPLTGATVTVVNASTSPPINLSANTNNAGLVSFPGSPVAGGYHISASQSGYSTAQTYTATAQNPNPSPGNIAVANDKTSTVSLSIDQLGALYAYTYAPPTSGSFADTFVGQSSLSATSSTTVVGGSLVLDSVEGVYAPLGSATSTPIAPAYLASWGMFMATTSVPANTSLLFHLYYAAGGSYVLVPDSLIPGNAAGFASTSVSLGGLASATYGTLALGAFLSTALPAQTPAVADWSVTYSVGPTPIPNIGMTIHGTKTIGTTATSSPIYKYSSNFTTSSLGDWFINPIEWDTYILNLVGSAYDVMERCPDVASISPGATLPITFTLVPHTAQSLRVYVTGGGAALQGATTQLKKGSTTLTKTTSACGQTFYSALAGGTYTLKVSKPGYQTSNQSVSVSGTTALSVPLSP